VNNLPSVRRIRETLAEFRQKISELAARGERLELEFAERRKALVRAHDQAIAQQTAEMEQFNSEQSVAHTEALARAERRYQSRTDRIRKALTSSQKRYTQQIDRENGREVFGFQKGTLESEQRRTAEITSAQDALAATMEEAAQGTVDWIKLGIELRSTFGVFYRFRKWLRSTYQWPEPSTASDERQQLEAVRSAFGELKDATSKMRRQVLPTFFRLMPTWVFAGALGAISLAAIFGLPALGRSGIELGLATAVATGVFVLFFVVKLLTAYQLRRSAGQVARTYSDAHFWLTSAVEQAQARYRAEVERIETGYQSNTQEINERWSQRKELTASARANVAEAITNKVNRANQRNERIRELAIANAHRLNQSAITAGDQRARELRERQTVASGSETARVEGDYATKTAEFTEAARRDIEPILAFFAQASAQVDEFSPAWDSSYWKDWTPPREYSTPPKIGDLTVQLAELAPVERVQNKVSLAIPDSVCLPVWLAYPEDGALVMETEKDGADEAVSVFNNLALRLLCNMPAGRLKLTVLDPVGLGQSFASLMHLADYAEAQGGTSQRIWTESNHIEQRLAELTEHLEKVIQMYLRNEFANLVEYNAHAGSIAEPHHLLLVTGFPVNFSDSAVRRLVNLIVNGPRCGIITLLHWDHRQPAPLGFVPEELRKAGVHIVRQAADFALSPSLGRGVRLRLDVPPPDALATELLHRIGRGSTDANKVEVPFSVGAPSEIWTESTIEEIRVPIGRTGASKLQYLSLGHGTRQHALISGKTGSGKSNLLHVIVTNLALRCGPSEIEFYLVDFKKGVEFKAYATAQLPQARVIAIESDREFGLSVLERLDEELRRRGELFRNAGVQDVPGYRRGGGTAPMPRCLLLVDEFQEFFVQEDRISQNAAVLLDRIVRQGRAFGIHVILASQTLGGTYALARATLGQMAVRIAFHSDEADAYLIMGDDNPAPKFLTRPGQGIYNDAAGALEANSPFQALWMPDDIRDENLRRIQQKVAESTEPTGAPVVFEGNTPARIEHNAELRRQLETREERPPGTVFAWMGTPNSIKSPTAAAFQRSGGSNLLVVGQRDEASLAIIVSALISLAAQLAPPAVRFVVVDSNPNSAGRSDILKQVIDSLPHPTERVLPGQLPTVLSGLVDELNDRTANGHQGRPTIFLIVVSLQNCKKVKPDDSFGFSSDPNDAAQNAPAAFQNLYVEGPSQGIHTIVSVDTYNNVTRFLGRKGLSEFEMRVLFQMSAADSSSLTDAPNATNLGLYGAIYYNDREGRTETFRPYAIPERSYIEYAARLLRREVEVQVEP